MHSQVSIWTSGHGKLHVSMGIYQLGLSGLEFLLSNSEVSLELGLIGLLRLDFGVSGGLRGVRHDDEIGVVCGDEKEGSDGER